MFNVGMKFSFLSYIFDETVISLVLLTVVSMDSHV